MSARTLQAIISQHERDRAELNTDPEPMAAHLNAAQEALDDPNE